MQRQKVGSLFVFMTATLLLMCSNASALAPEPQATPTPSPTPNTKLDERYKLIHIFARQGPYGELYVPKELAASSDQFKLARQVNENYFFPSIYFLVSAKPEFKIGPQRVKDGVQHWDFDRPKTTLKWINLIIKIPAVGCDDNPIDDPEKIKDKVNILAVLPDETLARVEEQKAAQLVGGLNEVTKAFAPLVPSQTASLEAGANTASGLFRNILYPPKLEAYRYSFINSPLNLGWHWKEDPAGQTSLIGTRRGILLLQIKKGKAEGIKQLRLSYELLAQWQGKGEPSGFVGDEYVDYNVIKEGIDFKAADPCQEVTRKDIFETAEYRTLRSLDDFPVLVPHDAVCKIFQVGESACAAKIQELERDYRVKLFKGTRKNPEKMERKNR